MHLHDKAALVTGGRRMGVALAAALARRGADVAITWNRSEVAADEAAAAVRAAGRRALVVRADLSDPGACEQAVRETAAAFGRLDVLLHLASVYRAVPFDALTMDEWDAQLGVDLRSSFATARAAAPVMRKTGGGRIVLFTDWVAASGRPRYPGYLAYYVAKSGVRALAEALALELAGDGILVNAVAPGPILAPDDLSADERTKVAAATPVGHWGGVEEIVKTVEFLLETDFVTGETIRVDGGRHIK